MKHFTRIICIVLDGVGVGEAPDAADYNDAGSNSLGNTAAAVGGLRLPNLAAMGLGWIGDFLGIPKADRPTACYGKLKPSAAGKDSTSGHWELMGCVLTEQMPTYPNGFPTTIIDQFVTATGRSVLGNIPASGTEIIKQLGGRHIDTGSLIVYTSQDSVFQIAAHEQVVPVEELYRYCEIARRLLVPPHGVGRVIARPFDGRPGGFYRTKRRRDYSLAPPRPTVLDGLVAAGRKVLTIGKIDELFAGRGITTAKHTADNREGMQVMLDATRGSPADLIFTNLVDFDTMWGHRNDARAYALGLEEFDSFLVDLLSALHPDDLLVITSDHGNDPTTSSTDHSREYVPVLIYHQNLGLGQCIGVGDTLADVGRSIAENFGLTAITAGRSFLDVLH